MIAKIDNVELAKVWLLTAHQGKAEPFLASLDLQAALVYTQLAIIERLDRLIDNQVNGIR